MLDIKKTKTPCRQLTKVCFIAKTWPVIFYSVKEGGKEDKATDEGQDPMSQPRLC